MKTSDFYFDLPEGHIAQTPLKKRDESKLMVIKKDGDIEHKKFYDILDFLHEGDVLVMNNTKVLPARIYGKKETGAVVEFLLLHEIEHNKWECLVKPGKRAKIDSEFIFSDTLKGRVVDITEEGSRMVEFITENVLMEELDKIGTMPLPPYITEKLEDQSRYQTVYSEHLGSAAAPTAGLHFTDDLLKKIKAKGVKVAYVTLHVGLGTFRPVKVDNVLNHKMHSEYYFIDQKNADIINSNDAKRIISVGTTSTRTLEAVMMKYNEIRPCSGWTDIFIYPGYEFKIVDSLITNFHLPESTLIMLVSAFSSKERILTAYDIAVKENYRFFSFGDAMFVE